jgi:hypothetical protein
LVAWYRQGKIKVIGETSVPLPRCPQIPPCTGPESNTGVNVERPATDRLLSLSYILHAPTYSPFDRGKPKYSGGGGNLSQCLYVRHKSHMDRPGIEPWSPRWETGD